MKQNMYAIYDKVAEVFNVPHFLINDELAVRNAYDAYPQAENINRHPEDFAIYRLGTFDDSDGTVIAEIKPVVVIEFTTIEQSIKRKQQGQELDVPK